MKNPRFILDNFPFLAAGALLTFLSSFGQTFFISIFSGEIREGFGLSHGEWGGIYMLGTGASAVIMVWAGGLTDLFRVRRLGPMIIGGLAVACLCMAYNRSAVLLPFIILMLRFFGQGMTSHIAVVAMARWFVAARGRALSLAALGFSAGEALLPILFASLMTRIDWHLLWVAGAGVCLVGAAVLAGLLGRERTPQSHAATDHSLGMLARHWTRGEALRHPVFWLMVPAMLGPGAFNTAFFFHQVHFAEIKGWTHVELVAFFPLYTALSILSMLGVGWLQDRLGTVRLIPFFQLPMVAAFAIFAWADGPVAMALGFLFLALTTGANATLPNAFWADIFGTAHIGSIKAAVAATMVLGSAIGPGLTGALIDLGLGLERQFLLIAAYFVLTTALISAAAARVAAASPARGA
ncbi:Major facilitator superfamily (MFS) transporter [Pseudooceanicola batsensis HTCC2597]|uniref:Major facilitator superfamily (MFS) transporter n=1 Tax=Pseudooceanicola batsensis (strain ATCC BAA-863 / DSM 15984 / KCTC 12145 / HTCC2597) TaxID=252305 RepID=A3TVM4_PSEBH|nr:MFS transporter [Pseudooceanicola batsensis]EAQ03670.1 Major facilitator superfamily (MFS) transporter [Pseudooceanicola batsensis HTCC2597]